MAGTVRGHSSARVFENNLLPILLLPAKARARRTAVCASITLLSVTSYTVPAQGLFSIPIMHNPAPLLCSVAVHSNRFCSTIDDFHNACGYFLYYSHPWFHSHPISCDT
jgi:hypothetical protein